MLVLYSDPFDLMVCIGNAYNNFPCDVAVFIFSCFGLSEAGFVNACGIYNFKLDLFIVAHRRQSRIAGSYRNAVGNGLVLARIKLIIGNTRFKLDNELAAVPPLGILGKHIVICRCAVGESTAVCTENILEAVCKTAVSHLVLQEAGVNGDSPFYLFCVLVGSTDLICRRL